MVKVTQAEIKLMEELKEFKQDFLSSLKPMSQNFSVTLTSLDEGTRKKIIRIFDTFNELEYLLESFELVCKPSSNKFWISWGISPDQPKRVHYANNDTAVKKLTTKTLMFALMEFENRVSDAITAIQTYSDLENEIFCQCLRERLTDIIQTYAES